MKLSFPDLWYLLLRVFVDRLLLFRNRFAYFILYSSLLRRCAIFLSSFLGVKFFSSIVPFVPLRVFISQITEILSWIFLHISFLWFLLLKKYRYERYSMPQLSNEIFSNKRKPIRDKMIIVTQRSTIHYYVNLLFVEDFIRHARFHRDR